MAEVILEVTRREKSGKEVSKKLRAAGKVPAVVYGAKKDPVAIEVERKAVVELIQKSEHGVRSIFLLKMAGTDQQRHAGAEEAGQRLAVGPAGRLGVEVHQRLGVAVQVQHDVGVAGQADV